MGPIPLNLRFPDPGELLNREGWFASVAYNPLRLEWVWDAAILEDGGRIGVDPGYQYWLPASAPYLPTMPPDHSETRASGMYNAPPSVLRALDRLAEYAAANPNHNTDEIVREARSAIAAQLSKEDVYSIYVTIIIALRDWLVPEEAELEDDGTSDGNDFMEELAKYEERQRLRYLLTDEANRVQHLNLKAK